MSQTSGVLIVGSNHNKQFDFGADYVKTFAEAKKYIRLKKPSVLVFGHSEKLEQFCEFALENSPQSLWVMSEEGIKPSELIHWTNFGRLHGVIESFEDQALEKTVLGALEAGGSEAQTAKLKEMFEDQSQQLKRLTNELEARVARRHKALRKSLKTLEQTKGSLESLHKALLGIHRASTILQMEQSLNEVLSVTMNVLAVKVRFASQSSIQDSPGVLVIEIPPGKSGIKGQVLFAKGGGKKFSLSEIDFLQELTEALSLALQRLHKLDEAKTFKAQWQATFDAIPHPLCITNDEFEILKMNLAFQQSCHTSSFRGLIGKNCFEAFFGDEFNPPVAMDSHFTFRHARTGLKVTEHYEVISEKLGMTHDNQAVQLVLLRSITDEVRFERRIFEGSKLAELGTIGSSIAHELNNPLGGMLSFLQLILMDVKPGDDLFPEIKGMEQGVLRCRDIVLNLLSFARKHDLSDISEIDLYDVIERSVKLIELQSKSRGIHIEMPTKEPLSICGSQNALSQALCNLLQNSIDAVAERLKNEPLFHGRITIHVALAGDKYHLRLTDNGMGIRPEFQSQIFNPLFTTRDPGLFSGMGLTTAFTIVSEHHGSLEILSQTGSGTTAILAVPISRKSVFWRENLTPPK
jgi:two-component system NtrC family sensor kinase